MPEIIDRSEGRALFGANPEGYEDARPPYPERLYQFLIEHRALSRDAATDVATLEIGAGSGLATRRLIEFGANPITVVEPDTRFAPLLTKLQQTTGADLRLLSSAFEDVRLPSRSFDLVVAASSYHWLDPEVALVKIADTLKPGGFVALMWNVFGDADREDPFHVATLSLLADQAISPSGAPDAVPFALDRAAREAEFARCGAFEPIVYFETRWTLVLDTARVGRLYEGFSHIQRLPQSQRESLLQRLMEIAQTQFGGAVERNVVSPIYLARRKRQ
jgi:SAM-dependent methyltransferase